MKAEEALSRIVSSFSGKQLQKGWSIKCPSHNDSNNSASVDLDGDKILITCHAGCSQDQVVSSLKSQGLWPEKVPSRTEYYYLNTNGEAVHRKVRIDPAEGKKIFTQEHLENNEWKTGAYDGELLPYDFKTWQNSDDIIFLVEGEKCADALKVKGLSATTTGGASSWLASYARHFHGKTVCIIPDNDTEGQNYATKAYDDISRTAKVCKILSLHDLEPKQDVFDWLKKGHSKDELITVATASINKAMIPFTLFKNLKPVDSGGSLIEDLLDQDNQSCLYGESNVGKSMLAIDMALHIAQGKPWFGKETKQGAVMYVAAEAGPSIAQRTEAYKIHHEMSDLDIPFAAIMSSIDLYDKTADTSRIIEAIMALERQTDHKCELVIVDTLAKAIAGANENAAQDMNSFLFNIERIRVQTKAHVLIVHHSGKDAQKGARGHSSLRAAMDTEIHVFDGGLKIKKQRSMKIIDEPIGFKLEEVELGLNSKGKKLTSCVVLPRAMESNAMRRIRSSERALQALECLKFVMDHEPKAPMVSTKSPLGIVVMSVKSWKTRFLEVHMLGVESRSSKDMAFKRAAEELQSAGKVGVDGEFCWLITHGRKDQ